MSLPLPLPHGDFSSTPYRILGELGCGGMGAVFEAEHIALQKRVVIKLLHPKLAKEPRIVERLEREARSLARLSSPFVVTVSDLGQTSDGATYLVLERLTGRTLRRELTERGALPLPEAIDWTLQVLAGLGAAHRSGIVHRDIKLDNLFLCEATEDEPRRLKLLDFGIAKVLDHPGRPTEPLGHQRTEEGTILGSPRWLAPEQARGKTVDTRADIYAVGVLLYTLVAGRGPFAHHRDPFEAIEAHISEAPRPPSHLARQPLPRELDEVVLTALAKLPEDRFQTTQAFSQALARIAARLGEETLVLAERAPWGSIAAPPCPDAEPTAVTLVEQRTFEAAAEGRESAAPTLEYAAQRSARRRHTVIFAALVTASTAIFFVVMASLAHLLGGR